MDSSDKFEAGRLCLNRKATLLLLTLLGVALIFTSLGNRLLWDDEAETAVLSRNILQFGIPKAFDGRNLVSQLCGSEYNQDYAWKNHPWLPMYVTAASFKLLGINTFSARLPFALIGVATLIALYLLAAGIFKSELAAILSTLLLLMATPFLLYVRQCRYYSIAMLAGVLIVYFFFRLLENKKFSMVGLLLAMSAFFHSNYAMFVGLWAALLISWSLFFFNRKMGVRLLIASVVTFLVNLPWILFFEIFSKSNTFKTSWAYYWRVLTHSFLELDRFVFPISFLLGFAAWNLYLRRTQKWRLDPVHRNWLFLAVTSAISFLLLCRIPILALRYHVHLFPLLAMLLAFCLVVILKRYRMVGTLLCGILLFTNIFNGWTSILTQQQPDKKFQSFIASYLDEITHDFDGPIEAIVNHIGKQASESDRIYISYGDLPLKFYLSHHEIRGGTACQSLLEWKEPPDWIIIRYFFNKGFFGPGAEQDTQETVNYLRHGIQWTNYHKIVLDAVDCDFENIPEPGSHVFRTPEKGEPVVIFRRKSG